MEYFVQRLTILAVIIGGLVLSLFLGIKSGESDVKLVLTIAGAFAIVAVYFGFYKFYWISTVAVLFFPGNFNFLPAGFQAFEILLILGVTRFVFDHVVFSGGKVRLGPMGDFMLILGIVAILFYHGLGDRFGMRILGSNVWGGRAYIEALFGFATYIILQTIRIDLKAWKWLPLIAFFPPAVDAGIKIFTKAVPAAATIIYPFYSGVSMEGPESLFIITDVANTMVQESRLGALASIGTPLALMIVSYCSLAQFWRPKFWVHGVLVGLSGVLCVLTGYRSSILGYLLVVIAACFRDFRWKIWVPILLGSLVIGGAIAMHSYGSWKMPLAAQRALVFLPGDWDPMVVQSAEGSDEFRFETWDRWYKEYFQKSPLIGRGFGFPIQARSAIWGNFQSSNDKSLRESLVLVGELHNGFISVIDRVGVLGCLLFLVWYVMTLKRVYRCLRHARYHAFNPALAWVSIYLSNWALLYVVGSLKFDHFFGPQLVLCGLMVRLMREADAARQSVATESQMAQGSVDTAEKQPPVPEHQEAAPS